MRRFSLSSPERSNVEHATRRGFSFGPAISILLMPAFLLGLTACDQASSPENPTAESPTSTVPSTLPESVPEPISSAEIQKIIRQSESPVVVSLWASWCRTARDATPDILPLQRSAQAGRIRWVFLCFDTVEDTNQHALPWLRNAGLDIPIHYKSAAETDAEFLQNLCPDWSGTLPATLLFDRDGTLLRLFETPVKSSLILDILTSAPVS